MNAIAKVAATLEMIKVVVGEIPSALRGLGDPRRIESLGFRTL
jgi:hypothetical protein